MPPAAPPPPPIGSPASWPPPPVAGPPAPRQAAASQASLSDTMDRMLRPQGLFQNRLPPPVEWQQPSPPAPPAYPPGGQYPQGNPYQQGSPYPPPPGNPYPPGNQFPPTGAFQQAAPPQAWGPAPTGAMPAAPGQPGSDVQYGPDGMPLPGGPPSGGAPGGQGLLGRLPFKRPLVPVAVGAGVVGIVGGALALSSQGGSSSNTSAAGPGAGAGPAASTSTGATTVSQQQAASSLSGLLQQSGSDRASVSAAVVDVEGCGNSLAKDVQVFNNDAANRHTLLSKLAQLPGRSALSPGMISDLTTAWQASATVDTDLAKWAQDQVGHCKKRNTKDPNYTATIPFDSQATNAKNAFVQVWTPLAKKDGLPPRQSSDL